MMNVLGVTDLVLVNAMRISPQDATFLSQDPHRLKGRKLGAFAGFLKRCAREHDLLWGRLDGAERSDEHTSELQSLMRISYAVFCLQKNKATTNTTTYIPP